MGPGSVPGVPAGLTPGDPAVKTALNSLDRDSWRALLAEIAAEGRYVVLDLSACPVVDMDGDGTAGTVFDPDNTTAAGKNRIVSLILPTAATGIAAGTAADPAFEGFPVLRSTGGANVANIGGYAFAGCAALESAEFPAVTTIGQSAFSGCSAMTTLNFPAAATIGQSAFSGCTALARANLAAVTDIGQKAFENTGPAALAVIMGNTAPGTLGTDIFDGVPAKTVTVKVPSGATDYAASLPAAFTETGPPYTGNWGNGFRGGGWNGGAMQGGTVNAGVTLNITE
jgi:hypothetical protein